MKGTLLTIVDATTLCWLSLSTSTLIFTVVTRILVS